MKLRKVLLLATIVLTVLLAAAPVWRLNAPTLPGWEIFPLKEEGLVTRNVGHWLAGRCYGRTEMLESLRAAARRLRESHGGSVVAYLDASGRRGGKLLGHLSHKKGLDVDVLFFGRDQDGRIYPRGTSWTAGYRPHYGEDGRGGGLRFDAERGWAFVAALRRTGRGGARVDRIFVDPHVERWLLAEGRRQGASQALLRWARRVLRYAGQRAAPHDDHFHIRFKAR